MELPKPHDRYQTPRLRQFLDDGLRRRPCCGVSRHRAWWEQHDSYHRHVLLLYNTVLHDVGTRRLEVTPQHPASSTSIPAACPPDPLWIYDRLRKIVR